MTQLQNLLTPLVHLAGMVFLALFLAVTAQGAHADQHDPALDGLFSELAASDDALESRRLLSQINAIWMQHPDQEVTQLMTVGTHMLNVGALPQATEVFRAMTEIDPNFAEGWNRLATVLFYRGMNAQALEPTLQVVRLETRHYGALWGLGMIYMRLGQPQKAKPYFELAHAIAPMLPGALDQAQRIDAPSDTGSDNFDLR